jgi:hypothetical protein
MKRCYNQTMTKNYTEEQIQAMIEKIRKIKPEEATRERAIKILNLLPEAASDISIALKQLVHESEKKLVN